MACGFLNKFKFSKKIKKFFLPHILLGPDVNAVTDPDYADEATGAESSSHEGEDTGPESSNDETRIDSRFQ